MIHRDRCPVLPGGGAKVTQQDQQAYDYHYATSTSLGESGLPALLDMYLYHHDVWAQAETYAQYSLHTSTQTSEVIHTNQKHPFFTLEQGFLRVSQITLGMHLLRADGRFGVVTSWKMVPGSQTMYNLEVARDHTFTVGDGQWVVHNSGGDCGDITPLEPTPTGSFTKMDKSYLKQLGIDAEKLKQETVGDSYSLYDIFRNENGDLFAMCKGATKDKAIYLWANLNDYTNFDQ